eukprot:gene42130-55939_t
MPDVERDLPAWHARFEGCSAYGFNIKKKIEKLGDL